MRLGSRLSSLFRVNSSKEKGFARSIKIMIGFPPGNMHLYRRATRHTSVASNLRTNNKESNERLEYLGDAVLGMVIADYLFKKYPLKDEGFLTEIRSRIVSRDALNQVARKIGIPEIVQYDKRRKTSHSHKSLFGNTLEALIGAIYLDKGFHGANKFIIKRLLKPHYDLEEIVATTKNYKSKLIEWAQKKGKTPNFQHLQTLDNGHYKEFIVEVLVDDETLAQGHGLSKKKAEQDASREACLKLEIASA